jgi:hypothetical protein
MTRVGDITIYKTVSHLKQTYNQHTSSFTDGIRTVLTYIRNIHYHIYLYTPFFIGGEYMELWRSFELFMILDGPKHPKDLLDPPFKKRTYIPICDSEYC